MLSSHLPRPHFKWNERQCQVLESLAQEFTLSTAQLEALTAEFMRQMQIGLTSTKSKDLAMIPTFITGRPDGHERGSYLALDLGGTNLR
ncbi:hexokinase A, partial [Mortierella alpina]